MNAILLIIGVIIALGILILGEILRDAWRELDKCKKEIERLKRQGITPRETE